MDVVRSRTIRSWLVIGVTIALSLRVAALALAATPPVAEPALVECDGCVTVIDVPAYDKFITVTDQAAYDAWETIVDVPGGNEPFTVVDVPAVIGHRMIVDTPATTIHHHDLVPEHTVTTTELIPGHNEPYQVWVPEGHWSETWIVSGYSTHDWISEGHSAERWVTSGYTTHDWVSSGYAYSYWVTSGYAQSIWVDTSHEESYSYWQPAQCWDADNGWYYDCGYTATGSRWVSSGYTSSSWVDTSHSETAWADTSHFEDTSHDTSHWQEYWVDTSHYVDAFHDTSHWREDWVDTSHSETRYRYVDDRYGPVDHVVPATYIDWDEAVAAVTHDEVYEITPAITHQECCVYVYPVTHEDWVHHDAVTHVVTVHHLAVGHLQRLGPGSTQSQQGAPPAGGGSESTATPVTEPVRIPIVTSLTLIDTPAHMSSVVVVDQAAYDQQVTVVDQAAYDEQVTVVDRPATTVTTTVVDAPAHTVSHHDLVTPATTVSRQVLVAPGYYQNVSTLVGGHYEYGNHWVSSGYNQNVWVSSGSYQPVWVSSGYWTAQWVTSGYSYQQWVSEGHYEQRWQPDYWVPWHCWGSGDDRDCDGGYTQPGYWYSGWVDTSHYESRWADTSHYEDRWVDTSSYQQQWVDSSHYENQWVDTSHYEVGQYWVGDTYISSPTYVNSGYMYRTCWWDVDDNGARSRECDEFWQPTGYWAYPNQAWVPPVYTTVYDPVAAIYNDWTEQVPAVTHTETVVLPAVTHSTTVHHDAVTHATTVHHDAVTHTESVAVAASTHEVPLAFDAIVGPSPDGTGSDDGLAQFALLMGLVAAAGAGRLKSTRDALRSSLAVWASNGLPAPASVLYLATDPSLTDAEVESRYAALTGTSGTVTTLSVPIDGDADDDEDPDDEVPAESIQPEDHPPRLDDPASQLVRAQFAAFLAAKRAADTPPVIYPDQIWMPPPGELGLDASNQSGANKFAFGFLKSLTDSGVGMVAGLVTLAESAIKFELKCYTDPLGAANDLAALVDNVGNSLSDEGRLKIARSVAYAIANETEYLGDALDSGDPERVGSALGDILFGSFSAATTVVGGVGLAKGVLGARGAVAAMKTAEAAETAGVTAPGATGVAARATAAAFTGLQPVIKGQQAERAITALLNMAKQPGGIGLLGEQITLKTGTQIVNGLVKDLRMRADNIGTWLRRDKMFNLDVKAGGSQATANQGTNWGNLAKGPAEGRGARAASAGLAGPVKPMPTILARVADDGAMTFSVEVRLASDTNAAGFQWADDLVNELNRTASQFKAINGKLVRR